MRFEFIRTGDHGLSIKRACKALNVSRSGYYEFVGRPKSKTRIAREALEPFVEEAFYANSRRFGSRRVTLELEKMGIPANRRTVQRVMSEMGLVPYQARKPYRRGGRASSGGANILNRDFSVSARNEVWCGDITYIPTREGWLYLATYLDLFSRKIVGWQVSGRINENLVVDALESAVAREDSPKGLMVHTDSNNVVSRFCGNILKPYPASRDRVAAS